MIRKMELVLLSLLLLGIIVMMMISIDHYDNDNDDDMQDMIQHNEKNYPNRLNIFNLRRIIGYRLFYPKPYTILSSKEIYDRMQLYQKQYPSWIRIMTSQKTYGLRAAGTAQDCTFDQGIGCYNYYGILRDYIKYPTDDDAIHLPVILYSGALHGNERIGPSAVMETAFLLLNATSCEQYPRMAYRNNTKLWSQELRYAKACRYYLFRNFGITDMQRQWLARLVGTRKIILVPTANALGYDRNIREEGTYDANRDFPYDRLDNDCMNTIAARTFNEIFRNYLIQVSLTFHAGMEVIGYEWGAPSWLSYNISPDEQAQSQIAGSMSYYANSFRGTPDYLYGQMNPLVYPVNGGMEDWAYASSFDPSRVVSCSTTSYGGYHPNKTIYNSSTLRAFNILIETSDDKIPTATTLGTTYRILDQYSTKRKSGNGHISRNIRLTLAATDIIEPYLIIQNVQNVTLSDDIIPGLTRTSWIANCPYHKVINVPYTPSVKPKNITIAWMVGGAYTIDVTQLWYTVNWNVKITNCVDPPFNTSMIQQYGMTTKGTKMLTSTKGYGRWSYDPNHSSTLFRGMIDLSSLGTSSSSSSLPKEMVIMVSAQVDADWGIAPDDAGPPDIPPQSHIVNVRTNRSWYHRNDHTIIQGRNDWFSLPITIRFIATTNPTTALLPYEATNRMS